MTPRISVVIVSDYASGGPEGWKDIHRVLTELARQEFTEPVEGERGFWLA